MNNNYMTVTDEQIDTLRMEAEADSDTAMVRLCYAAYDEDDARDTVARVIADAAAMAD